jgi:hypothetical protein
VVSLYDALGEPGRAQVMFCRGCGRAWVDLGVDLTRLDPAERAAADPAACPCPASRRDWTPADPASVPEGAWDWLVTP